MLVCYYGTLTLVHLLNIDSTQCNTDRKLSVLTCSLPMSPYSPMNLRVRNLTVRAAETNSVNRWKCFKVKLKSPVTLKLMELKYKR